jgi:hypothetical protein
MASGLPNWLHHLKLCTNFQIEGLEVMPRSLFLVPSLVQIESTSLNKQINIASFFLFLFIDDVALANKLTWH